MEFEEYITRELVFDDSNLPDNVKEYEDLKKAAKCILIIRKRVKSIVNNYKSVEETAYWTELLVRTLKYVSYKSSENDSSLTDSPKKYALISALLITDNYFNNYSSAEENSNVVILSGPHLNSDPVLSSLSNPIENKELRTEEENESLAELRRSLLAGHTVLFLGPNAPKSSSAPTMTELANKLFCKYTGNKPKINKADTIFNLLLSLPQRNSVFKDIYSIYDTTILNGIYAYIPQISWKRIYIEYIDFLVERAYEECSENKKQDYDNRFSLRESRDDENINRVIVERPYGSVRFYGDSKRSPQLSAQSIASGRSVRIEWHKLLTDIRSPMSVLFYGFEWGHLRDLYYEINEYVTSADGNANFFWATEDVLEEDEREAKFLGMKLIYHPLGKLFEEIIHLDKGYIHENNEDKITISIKDEKIYLDTFILNNYISYFEVLHDYIENDSKLEIGSFFKGEEINWSELAKDCDVSRNQIINSRLENKIVNEFKRKEGSNKCFLLVSKYAGAGTTTIMKRLGFNISKRKICPVVYLHKLDQNSWKMLEDYYHLCKDKKLLILIDNVSTQLDRFRELYSLLESRRVSNVILATARMDEWNQVMTYYVQNSGEHVDSSDEEDLNLLENESKTKKFKWIKTEVVDDILTSEEKNCLIQKFIDFGLLTKSASSRFGVGFSRDEIKYSNLLLLCWAATQGENKKFGSVVNEYYKGKLTATGRKVVDVICAVSLFYSKGITDKMLHRVIKVNWDNFKILLSDDSIQQLIKTSIDYYESKEIVRIIPRNYGIAEILLRPNSHEFPQKILQIITENLIIKEGEKVEEDILFNIVRNKRLHKYLNDKSSKNKLFEFAYVQSPSDTRILQHWGIMLYDHAKENAKLGNLESSTWDESLDVLNRAYDCEPFNAAILHSLGMVYLIRGGLYWKKYLSNLNDKNSYELANYDFEHSIEYFKKSQELAPAVEYAYNTILKILFRQIKDCKFKHDQRNFEHLMFEAHELLEEYAYRVPSDQQVFLNERKAKWNELRGKTSEAERQYRELLDNNSKNHSVRYLLAALLFDKNDIKSLDEAEKILEKAIEEGPRSKGFYRLRYKIAERLHPFEYQKLQSILNSMVAVFPEDPFFVFKYGVVSFKNENYIVSREYFRISDRLRFGDPTRFDRHDYIWKSTEDTSKIEQMWSKKVNESLLEKFEGNIDTIENNRAFIIMDISGEIIFFDPRGNREEHFQEGDRVQFNISFNLIGPTAINYKKT